MSTMFQDSVSAKSFTIANPAYSMVNGTSNSENSFPISHLPYEIRQLIYNYYFGAHQALSITIKTLKAPSTLNGSFPLSQASPYFTRDLSPLIIQKHATFAFSNPAIFQDFALQCPKLQKLRIEVGQGTWHADWVFLMLSCCLHLEDVTFIVPEQKSFEDMQGLWACIVDAVREGTNSKRNLVMRIEENGRGVFVQRFGIRKDLVKQE